ncbi:DUF1365 domain-containing protein [Massilia arenosa]|uniref:DUF1365 domain-containing protein n=1 Tax=Zemynaea arenosa TaxID=2561931 RepID=A0A4Y9S692_9BURK|nr:DUF1365 domain-containing protein [Massilia arenosa]TFW16907.1 DUF1365 domain-containing protein [Massilia arenosa]
MTPAAELVTGQVMHLRLRPRRHRFVYPVCYLRLDVDRLGELASPWFAIDRWRPLSLRTRDYGPRDGSALAPWIRTLLREHGLPADGAIWLQTFPRVFGYVFNPVSFWHCHDAAGRLVAVLAEVNNTFGEHHRYLLRVTGTGSTAAAQAPKLLHVSPFCTTTGHYRFRFRAAGAAACIDYHDADGLLIRTAIGGRAVPLSARAAAAALFRFPLLGVGIIARIHWQALRLWLKGTPWYRKPPPPPVTTTLHQETAP